MIRLVIRPEYNYCLLGIFFRLIEIALADKSLLAKNEERIVNGDF